MTKNLTGIVTKLKIRPGDEGKMISRITETIESMDLRALKRNAIIRGLPFDKLADMSVLNLSGWLIKNFNNLINVDLLDDYDIWVEKVMKSSKMDEAFFHPAFRLGFVAEKDEDGNVTAVKKPRDIKKPKKGKKVKTTDGIFSGTKKAYTYELQKSGKSKEETIKMVLAKYPDAKDKSVGIWWKRSAKANGGKKK